MKKTTILLIVLAITMKLNAQQTPDIKQYLLNAYTLSPANAGYSGNIETFMTYRQSWNGIDGAPVTTAINVNTPLNKNMGAGLMLVNDKIGIFNNFTFKLTYAVHLQTTQNQSLSFGISGELLQNQIKLADARLLSLNDPALAGSSLTDKTMPDIQLGLTYRIKSLQFGIAIDQLLENANQSFYNQEKQSNYTLYKLSRHYLAYIHAPIELASQWQLEPYIILRQPRHGKFYYEGAALLRYNDQVWIGLSYQQSNSIGISIGAKVLEKIAINYTYEYSTGGITGINTGIHDITVGVLIGKANKIEGRPSFFNTTSRAPYFDWIK